MITSLSSLAQEKKSSVSLHWKIAGELPAQNGKKPLGLAGPVVGVNNNVMIVGGGANFPDSMPWLGGKKRYYNEVYIFKKTKNGELKNVALCSLPFSLAYSASCSTSQGVVAVGGENENGISSKVLLIKWTEASKKLLVKDLPDLPYALTNATVASIGNQVFLAGGETSKGASDVFLVLDLDHQGEGWKQLPSLPKPLAYAVMSVQSDGHDPCIYVLGGRRKSKESLSDFYTSLYRFNLKSNGWEKKEPLPYGLSAGTGVATGTHSILLFGGDRGETFHKTEEVILAMAAEKDEEKKRQLNHKRIALQTAHPGFSKEVLLYNTVRNEWTVCGSIPFDAPATTTAVRWGKWVYIPNGEIRAGVRTPYILGVEIGVK